MKRITITLEVPDGVAVQVVGAPRDDVDGDPLVPWDGLVGDAPQPVFRAVATAQPMVSTGVCPVHSLPWRVIPGGISKKTGRSYGSFRACPATGCDERP